MRGMTLKQIEAAVGVSATHVSEIERGKTSPTIGALGKIAKALCVGVACLIEPQTEPGIYTSSPSDRVGYSLDDGKIVMRPLSNGFQGSELTMMEVEIAPGAEAEPRPQRDWGEELIVGLEGDAEIVTGSETYALESGDSLHINVEGALRFRNAGAQEARLLWATYPKYML